MSAPEPSELAEPVATVVLEEAAVANVFSVPAVRPVPT